MISIDAVMLIQVRPGAEQYKHLQKPRIKREATDGALDLKEQQAAGGCVANFKRWFRPPEWHGEKGGLIAQEVEKAGLAKNSCVRSEDHKS